MALQTAASVLHWLDHDDVRWHRADVSLSLGVFGWHVWRAAAAGHRGALACGAGSALLFSVRKGCREAAILVEKNNKQDWWRTLRLVVPHAAFRYLAFWMVMLVHGQPWRWSTTLFYVGGVVAACTVFFSRVLDQFFMLVTGKELCRSPGRIM